MPSTRIHPKYIIPAIFILSSINNQPCNPLFYPSFSDNFVSATQYLLEMEKKMIRNPLCPFYFVALVRFLIFFKLLDWAISIHKWLCGDNANTESEKKNPNPERLNSKKQQEKLDDGKLHRGEVEMVMEKLGISCDPDAEKLQEKLGLEEVMHLFEEKGPTSEEVKEAFEVFDENRDGYIDAEELQRVLCALGLLEGSESRDCKKMIGTFDINGDGRIDFPEFVKFMEISFS